MYKKGAHWKFCQVRVRNGNVQRNVNKPLRFAEHGGRALVLRGGRSENDGTVDYNVKHKLLGDIAVDKLFV